MSVEIVLMRFMMLMPIGPPLRVLVSARRYGCNVARRPGLQHQVKSSAFEVLLPRNESSLDRALRVALGSFALSLTFWGPNTLWGLVGLVPLVTGLVGSCPLYRLFGIKTCERCDTSAT